VADPNRNVLAPEDAGVWRMDLASGKTELLISYQDAVRIPNSTGDWKGAKHWFNHLLYSPDGARFVFLHRWRTPDMGRAFHTRMFTCDAGGKNLKVWEANNRFSHFNWRDQRTIIMWCWQTSHEERFYAIDAITGTIRPYFPDELTRNGHNSFLRGSRWLLSDSSPDKDRLQHPYLFDTQTRRMVPLGHLYAAPEYTGFWRCDTTPRSSPDGRKVIVDSPHGGNGRQMYLFDVSAITKS
jgi:hypothetical protein